MTVTRHDGQVLALAADWPAKASVTVDTGLQAALRGGLSWPPVIGPAPPARLLVEVDADGKRPIAVNLSPAPEDRDVITGQDRELLAPVLGGPEMIALMERDRDAWKATGALIVRAFTAGKKAGRHKAREWVP